MSALPLTVRAPRLAGALAILATGALSALLGVAVAVQPLAVVGLAVVALGALVAVLRPAALALAAVALVGLVPVYAAPRFGPIDLDPAVLLCWAAAGGMILSVLLGRASVRPHVLDYAVALYVGVLSLSVLFAAREPGEYVQVVLSTVGPYLALRLVVPRLRADWVPRAFALAAVLALPFLLYEFATATNPFKALNINPAESLALEEQVRFGVRRVEGAFGHAIGLSFFAGMLMVLALGSAALATRRAARWAWLAVGVAGAVMLAISVSRTGFIVFAAGLVLLALFVLTGRNRRRLLWSLGAATLVGALVVAALGLDELIVRLVDDNRLSASNSYREILLQRALRGEGLELFGVRQSSLGAGIDAYIGRSIDNAYLDIAANWGYVGGAGFVLVGLALAFVLWRLSPGPWALIPAATLAVFAGLLAAAILTSMEFWLWMLIGASGGAYAVAQAARESPGAASRGA